MTEFNIEPMFRTYMQILHHIWRVGSITALGLPATLGFSHTAHKRCSATARLLNKVSKQAGYRYLYAYRAWPSAALVAPAGHAGPGGISGPVT